MLYFLPQGGEGEYFRIGWSMRGTTVVNRALFCGLGSDVPYRLVVIVHRGSAFSILSSHMLREVLSYFAMQRIIRLCRNWPLHVQRELLPRRTRDLLSSKPACLPGNFVTHPW